jgi:thymidylate kinase
MDLDWLLHVYEPLFWPDLVFYFSVTLETSTQRLAATRAPETREESPARGASRAEAYRRFLARVIREYEALALIFQFITIDAEQPIYEQHRNLRTLFGAGQRHPWADRNLAAMSEWLLRRFTPASVHAQTA